MAKVERFEDLIAWQKARELNRAIYNVSNSGLLAKDFGLRDQMRRASVSVMANIAEGFERGKRTEFHQFLSTAKASCGEVRSHLYAALDAGHILESTFSSIREACEEVSRVLGALRAAVQKQRDSGKDAR